MLNNNAIPSRPTIHHYQRHVLLCSGKKCDHNESRALIRYMKGVLKSMEIGSDRVRVNRAGCLGVCKQGAIMCVYPEAVWYCNVDQEAVDRIIHQHLIGNVVVTDLLFHHNQFNDPEVVA